MKTNNGAETCASIVDSAVAIASPPAASPPAASSLRCAKCSNKAKKGCVHSLCLKCCVDSACEVHKEQRAQALFREQVMAGTTAVQLQAKEKRAMQIHKKNTTNRNRFFRESGFEYMGDTIVIFKLSDYLNEPKLKEEALRKSAKRKQMVIGREGSSINQKKERKISRQRRCRQVMESLYQQTLK